MMEPEDEAFTELEKAQQRKVATGVTDGSAANRAMTQEDVIEMADKADAEADKVLNMKGEYHPNWHQVRDEIFAKLVAAKEREECAKLVEEPWQGHPKEIAKAIRARGEA